jgi:hypothetical protein
MSHFNRGSSVAIHVAAARILDRQIAKLQAERKAHLSIVEPLVETGRHTVEGQDPFTVSENNVYDEAVIRASLKPGQLRRVSILKVDKPSVKRLYPDAYNGAKDNRGVKFTL